MARLSEPKDLVLTEQNLQAELDSILGDLTRLGEIVARRELEEKKTHDIYLMQSGTHTFELHVDSQLYYLDRHDLQNLADRLAELGITSSPGR